METNLIEKVKEYLSQKKDVAFAFLYGSQAKGNSNRLSDVDTDQEFKFFKRGN